MNNQLRYNQTEDSIQEIEIDHYSLLIKNNVLNNVSNINNIVNQNTNNIYSINSSIDSQTTLIDDLLEKQKIYDLYFANKITKDQVNNLLSLKETNTELFNELLKSYE